MKYSTTNVIHHGSKNMSLNSFLSMDGYAVYVWSAYSISFIVLFLNISIAIRNEHKTLNKIKERLQNNKK